MDNITQIFNAPLFVVMEILEKIGYKSKEMMEWGELIQKRIEQLKIKESEKDNWFKFNIFYYISDNHTKLGSLRVSECNFWLVNSIVFIQSHLLTGIVLIIILYRTNLGSWLGTARTQGKYIRLINIIQSLLRSSWMLNGRYWLMNYRQTNLSRRLIISLNVIIIGFLRSVRSYYVLKII